MSEFDEKQLTINRKNDDGSTCRIRMYLQPISTKGILYGEQNFYPVGWCFNHVCYVWPIDEFIAKMKAQGAHVSEFERHKLKQAHSIYGRCECALPLGWQAMQDIKARRLAKK